MLLKCWRSEQCWFASNNYSREQFKISTDNRSIKIAFAMLVIERVGEFLNTLAMQYELRYKWWIIIIIVLVDYSTFRITENIITFLFEKLSCAVEILIWSDAVDFLTKLLGMPYSVVTAQQACSTEMVNLNVDKLAVWPEETVPNFGLRFTNNAVTMPTKFSGRNSRQSNINRRYWHIFTVE